MSKINKITPLTHVKFLNLYELEAENKFGDTHPYYVASRKDEETMMAATKKVIPDGVVIYSLFGEKADKLIMVKQFRYPLNDYTYELPAGLIDPGESVKETAIREMMEELKVSREQIHMIAQMDTLYTAYDNKVSVYLCELTDYEMTYNADEVAEIFTVPLKFFMETEPVAYVNTVRLLPPDNFPYEQIPGGRNYHWRDGHKKVYFYYYRDWIIWGLTAYVLRGVVRTLKAELPKSD